VTIEYVRRQVLVTFRVVVDVDKSLDESTLEFLFAEHYCNVNHVTALARECDKLPGSCSVCGVSEAKLVPKGEELENEWLDSWDKLV
jgi:hypothetical protein